MAEKHPDYWRIKSAYQQYQIDQTTLRDYANKIQAALAATLAEVGLKPEVHYTLDDATESIIEAETPS